MAVTAKMKQLILATVLIPCFAHAQNVPASAQQKQYMKALTQKLAPMSAKYMKEISPLITYEEEATEADVCGFRSGYWRARIESNVIQRENEIGDKIAGPESMELFLVTNARQFEAQDKAVKDAIDTASRTCDLPQVRHDLSALDAFGAGKNDYFPTLHHSVDQHA